MAKKSLVSPRTEDSWRVEDDLRICQQYKQIERDPARMKAVRKLAKQRLADMQQVVDEASETEKE